MIFGVCNGISLRLEPLTPKVLLNAVRPFTVPITAINVATIAAVERQQCRIYNSHEKWNYLQREPTNYFATVNSIDITIRGIHTCNQVAIHYGCYFSNG
jgi:hypothetical protein